MYHTKLLTAIVIFVVAISAIAQPEGPFVLDDNTMALWHMNQGGLDELWSVTFGGDEHDVCSAAIRSADGNFLLGGYTRSFGEGVTDIYLLKVNSDGE